MMTEQLFSKRAAQEEKKRKEEVRWAETKSNWGNPAVKGIGIRTYTLKTCGVFPLSVASSPGV